MVSWRLLVLLGDGFLHAGEEGGPGRRLVGEVGVEVRGHDLLGATVKERVRMAKRKVYLPEVVDGTDWLAILGVHRVSERDDHFEAGADELVRDGFIHGSALFQEVTGGKQLRWRFHSVVTGDVGSLFLILSRLSLGLLILGVCLRVSLLSILWLLLLVFLLLILIMLFLILILLLLILLLLLLIASFICILSFALIKLWGFVLASFLSIARSTSILILLLLTLVIGLIGLGVVDLDLAFGRLFLRLLFQLGTHRRVDSPMGCCLLLFLTSSISVLQILSNFIGDLDILLGFLQDFIDDAADIGCLG